METLSGLVAAHTSHIPFENLDPLLGRPVTELGPAALVDKLVRRRRGGYCYEQNNLMRYVLIALGFSADRLAGRVVWMSPAGLDGPPRAETHLTLAVRIPGDTGEAYLVDVGFGGQTPTSPIRLIAGPAQQTRNEPYRLRRYGSGPGGYVGYVLEALLRDGWRPLYTFTTEPRPLIDMEVGSWYVSTNPRSKFVGGLSAALVTGDARSNLRGRNLSVHTRGGSTNHVRLDTAAQVVEALADTFGIDLTGLGDAGAVEARVAQVLDN